MTQNLQVGAMTCMKQLKRYTLAELLIAVTALMVMMAALMPLFTFVIRTVAKTRALEDLETQAMITQEWIKHDLRRTSRSQILMWPSYSYQVEEDDITYSGNSICISFPTLNRADNDASLPLNDDGEIDWNQTIIYHVSYNSETGTHELRRTLFEPRDNTFSSTERYLQLIYTWWYGTGAQCGYNSANASTQVLANDVNNYLITSGIADVDAYHASQDRQLYPIGTWVIDPGYHIFRFQSEGKNDSSSGYNIGLDEIRVSATGAPYDLECLLPAHSYNGLEPVASSMYNYSGWRNNAQMLFPATSSSSYVNFEIHNDMWLESTFNYADAIPENVEVTFDHGLGENVCQMSGNDIAWEATLQTIGATVDAPGQDYENSTFRTIIGGADPGIGGNIAYSGANGQVTFRAAPGSGNLHIESAYIMTRDSGCNGSGTPVQLTFGTATGSPGAVSVTIPQGTAVTSDLFDLPISPDNDYLVSFHLGEDPTTEVGRPAAWHDSATSETHTYHIPHAAGDTANESGTADWSSYSASVAEINSVLAVECLFVTYPATATYTSRIMDTRMDNPQHSVVRWRETLPTGTDISIKVRSGDSADMSDALAWTSAPVFNDPDGTNSLSTIIGGRYIQWQASLTTASPYSTTPKLRDVRILWPGQRRGVDVAVAMERDSDMGKFSLRVDGRTPAPAALNMSFTIGRETFAGDFDKQFSVDASPRNK